MGKINLKRMFFKKIFKRTILVFLPASLFFLFLLNPKLMTDDIMTPTSFAYTWCFPAGTLVRTPEGERPIETLELGDSVIGVGPVSHEERVQKVVSLHEATKSELRDLSFASGRKITASEGHPFAVWNDKKTEFLFVPVEKLWVGAESVVPNNDGPLGSDAIVSVDKKDGAAVVYNLSVAPDETFIAGGVLVHNKTTKDTWGSYWNGKGWSCPGGGHHSTRGCWGTGGSAFHQNPVNNEIPGPEGTIIAYAFVISDKNSVTTCDKLVKLKACLDNPTTPETTECAAFTGKQYFMNTVFYLEGLGGPEYTTQTTTAGVTFTAPSNVTYVMNAANDNHDYSSFIYCNKNNTTDTNWILSNRAFLKTNDTMTVLTAFAPTYPWLQVQGGGNTYGKNIQSLMPIFITQTLLFDNTQSPLTPGIFSAGESADLWDFTDPEALGAGNVSRTNWSVKNAQTTKDWYAFFSQRLVDTTKLPYPPSGTINGTKPPLTSGAPYTVYATQPNTNLTIVNSWNIAAGQKLIIVVDGNLTIKNTITMEKGGFIAFIVKGDIIVDSSVGVVATSVTPVVEGVYIAGGTLKTGLSTTGKERFVGKGMFAANKVLTQRNITTSNYNTSADLFLYNPELLITMPSPLEDNSFIWQEVAP